MAVALPSTQVDRVGPSDCTSFGRLPVPTTNRNTSFVWCSRGEVVD
jgi:hypothetical protein